MDFPTIKSTWLAMEEVSPQFRCRAKNGRTRIRLGLRCKIYVSIIHCMTTYCNNFVVLQIWTRFQDLQSHYSGHKALYLVQNSADWKIRVVLSRVVTKCCNVGAHLQEAPRRPDWKSIHKPGAQGLLIFYELDSMISGCSFFCSCLSRKKYIDNMCILTCIILPWGQECCQCLPLSFCQCWV